MRVLVTGGHGQLGRALVRRGLARGIDVIALGRDALDVCDAAAVDARIASVAPRVVINAAAFTAVDRAELELEAAYAVNRDGAATVARACARRGVRLLHVSTNYVFDGEARVPYREDDAVAPVSMYGESKAAGERDVHDAGGVVVRTSWLFETRGPSFVHSILRLAGREAVLRIVDDQLGCPTWADDLADALFAIAALPHPAPTYHACNVGPTTWHGFATAIVDEARRYRPLRCEHVEPIATREYPTPARRPRYGVLETRRLLDAGVAMPSWRPGLARVIAEVMTR